MLRNVRSKTRYETGIWSQATPNGMRTKWVEKSRAKRQSNGPKLVKCLNENRFHDLGLKINLN